MNRSQPWATVRLAISGWAPAASAVTNRSLATARRATQDPDGCGGPQDTPVTVVAYCGHVAPSLGA